MKDLLMMLTLTQMLQSLLLKNMNCGKMIVLIQIDLNIYIDMVGPGKGALKRPNVKKSSNSHDLPQSSNSRNRCDFPQSQFFASRKGQTYFRLHDEEFPTNTTFPMENTNEYHQEDDFVQIEMDRINPQDGENVSSTSHGTSFTRKESRALSESKKRRVDKGKLVFEVDECAGRIVGEDSQRFITKGGCVMREYAKFDGTTWKNQSDLLKTDIISKCTENSDFDPNSRSMVRAIQTQLGIQHKNKQYKLHLYYKRFPTTTEASRHPPSGITEADWVKLCQRFASEEFKKISIKNKKNRSMNEIPPAVGTVSIARIVDKKRREGEEVSAIQQYKIGHFSEKKNKMVNEKAEEIWNQLQSEEVGSSHTPTEICLKMLGRIPGHIKGRSTSIKQTLAIENLRMELELEKKKSQALEEEVRIIKEEQIQFHEEQAKFQEDQIKFKEELNGFHDE